MGLFASSNPKENKHSGILGSFSADLIKWEPEAEAEASVIAHKFEYEDFPNGSSLIVGPSQIVVFTNNLNAGSSLGDGSDGSAQFSVFIGPCKIRLETGDSRFAPFRNLAHTFTDGESAFHSTVYFLNTTYMNDLSWGTQEPILVVDPDEQVNVHVRAYGLFGVHLESHDTTYAQIQARKFLQKVVGTRSNYTRDDLTDFMRAKILESVPNHLANAIVCQKIGVLQISTHLTDFSQAMQEQLVPHFDGFGLTLDHFTFNSINVPEDDLSLINEAKVRRKVTEQEAMGSAAKMDIESSARAREREREGYTYQQEQAFHVMKAAAENEGTSSSLMGAGMGLGMGFGVGSAFRSGMQSVADAAMDGAALSPDAAAVQGLQRKQCPECGAANENAAKFCISCGHAFRSSALICPVCGKALEPGSKFCSNCGQKVEEACFCPECGKKLLPGTKFCPECGRKIE